MRRVLLTGAAGPNLHGAFHVLDAARSPFQGGPSTARDSGGWA